MTVQLNFDKINQQRLLPLLEWLREIGLVKSYQVADSAAVDGEVFLNRMLENAEKDIAEGNLMTSEEVTQNLESIIKKDKSGVLAKVPQNQIIELLDETKLRVHSLGISAKDSFKVFATLLYDKEVLSAGQAADLAGIPKADFIRQMGKYRVSAFGETVEEISAL